MVIQDTPQVLKRVSLRWLPDPAFEDTDTIALNVGGYFMDLRVTTADGTLQWSRAGERKTLGQDPLTFQWTRIIDSFGSDQADEAAFTSLPNGDDLETGTFTKDGVPTAYEEVWRDVTETPAAESCSWIVQSTDGSAFLGKIGHIFLGMQQGKDGSFGVRKEIYSDSKLEWEVTFEAGPVQHIPRASEAVRTETALKSQDQAVGGVIEVSSTKYVVRGVAFAS